MKRALLALADGTIFEGRAFGAEGEAVGEVVFNTSMTGYQEVLTDPSYKGQMVVMTYPLIGNYGINPEDVESRALAVEGFIVKEASPYPSNWRSAQTLDSYLTEQGIVGIQGIDTRALTRHLRDHGAMEGVISTQDLDPERLIAKAKGSPGLIGRDLVKEVACTSPYTWHEGPWQLSKSDKESGESVNQLKLFPSRLTPYASRYKVVAYDCGIKLNILRKLIEAGCDVSVVPPDTPTSMILGLKPDGIFLSNGPGDPEGVPYLIDNVRKLIGTKPIFGICLGHQILGLALGGRTYKLKFGHHGGNQPVKDLTTGKVEITTQNHGFAVDIASIPDPEVELTHINLNDHTVEGMRHRRLPIFSVQYHPEASPGPHDASYLFERFVGLMAQAGAR
ncbi:MAG: carbamoyl phosphate synthase small subunit [Candidatus Methylomirabilota bacterium]|nr:glutamine-hydrolyzing carbamoyl-phosphate synthase small subunit [Candidatus Methylomirabilis sp.]NJD69535.1 glutamine-hydrolyzing carbamoyl-phosphate synthase small subunit [candidate division NC10 bacterium]PWB45811.1 MAG: carbamoyl phosphate synthase small subunit [candidate division NC10 bacterium]